MNAWTRPYTGGDGIGLPPARVTRCPLCGGANDGGPNDCGCRECARPRCETLIRDSDGDALCEECEERVCACGQDRDDCECPEPAPEPEETDDAP